jgi:hypothetical protein
MNKLAFGFITLLGLAWVALVGVPTHQKVVQLTVSSRPFI